MARRTCNQGMEYLMKDAHWPRSLLEGAGGLPVRPPKRQGPPEGSPCHAASPDSVLVHTQFLFQVVDVHPTFDENLVAGQVAVQRHVGLDAVDPDFVKGIAHA